MKVLKSTRRGAILIEPYKQLRFGIMFLFINLIFSSLLLGVFLYFLWDIYEALSVYFRLDASQTVITMTKLMQPAAVALLLVILFIGATLAMSARYTHQIYGPMVSVRRFLDELLEGRQPHPIRLRASDQLQDLVIRLNEIPEKLKQKAPQPSPDHTELLRQLDQLIAGEAVAPLALSKDHPLYDIAIRINQLAKKLPG
ncbi:MAG: hypothetical protein H6618_04240 [Deltaproteobacteria bacterium]|nr:hypothetical protein [Deltaproteobacteria bacterium]